MNKQNQEVAIEVINVTKDFRLPHEKHNSVKGSLIGLFNSNRSYETQIVLKEVSFQIKKGEFFGIVGRNGSGKSTLLKMLAGIYDSNSGTIKVNGKLTPFIELGVGFNPELTGRENVFLNGALLGFSRKEMNSMYDEIVNFSELHKFMDQKLKNYSSGMQVRLAFSVAIQAKSEILLLDEVLAVGDALFQKKCYDYFKQLKKEKRTVVFVSHDSGALLEYCDKGILLEKGQILKSGQINSVVSEYIDVLNKNEQNNLSNQQTTPKRRGNGNVTLKSIVLSKLHQESKVYVDEEDIEITTVYEVNKNEDSPVFGITITDLTGQIVFQSNTLWCEIKVKTVRRGELVAARWIIPNVFNSGTYVIAPACSDSSGTQIFDWVNEAKRFKVHKIQKSHGIINTKHLLEISYEKKNI